MLCYTGGEANTTSKGGITIKKSKFRLRLKSLREQYNYTQEDIANALGLSATSIANYESGRRRPEYETLSHIADVFGVTTDYLIGRSNNSSIESVPEYIKDIALNHENFEWIKLIPYLRKVNIKPQTIKNVVSEIRNSLNK